MLNYLQCVKESGAMGLYIRGGSNEITGRGQRRTFRQDVAYTSAQNAASSSDSAMRYAHLD